MSAPRPLSVSRPAASTPALEDPPPRQARYRAGKTTVVVHLTPDQHEMLALLTFDLRKKRPRRRDGRPLAQVDLVREALDDFFEKHQGDRPLGTLRSL